MPLMYMHCPSLYTYVQVGHVPLMYMNGWDVFEALPDLWADGIDQLPGSTSPLTASEYRR